MVDLKCKKFDCIHNEHGNCFARYISVDKQTCCCSFKEANGKKPDAEMSDEIAQPIVRPSVDVECRAKCVFNCNDSCKANGITVLGENGEPECTTFLPE